MKKYLIILVISLLALQGYGQNSTALVSKKGTTAGQFLHLGIGARALSMGSAFVAVSDDPTAVYWNPAGLTNVKGVQTIFDHTKWIADINYNFFVMSFNFGDIGSLGISYTASDIEDMEETTVAEPNGTGKFFSVKDYCFSISYAYALTNDFSIGLTPKVVYQSIKNISAAGFAADLGVLYKTPFEGFTLGAGIYNFGTRMRMDGFGLFGTTDPDKSNSGTTNHVPYYYQTQDWHLPLNFKVGLSYLAIKDDMNKLVLSAEASHPSDNYESVNLGGEYVFGDFLSFRGGYNELFQQDSEKGFTLGGGIRQAVYGTVSVSVDYSYMDFGRLKNTQKFTLGLLF